MASVTGLKCLIHPAGPPRVEKIQAVLKAYFPFKVNGEAAPRRSPVIRP